MTEAMNFDKRRRWKIIKRGFSRRTKFIEEQERKARSEQIKSNNNNAERAAIYNEKNGSKASKRKLTTNKRRAKVKQVKESSTKKKADKRYVDVCTSESRSQPIACGGPFGANLCGNQPMDPHRRTMPNYQHPLTIGLVEEAKSNRLRRLHR